LSGSSTSTITPVVLLVALSMPTLGMTAQTPPLAGCHGLEDAQARLDCYDRVSGRDALHPGDPVSLPARRAGARVPAADAPSDAPVPAAAARGDAMIDRAWAQRPGDRRFLVTPHYRNYALLARYSTSVNQAPYRPLSEAFDEQGRLDPVEAKYQISFKARVWADESRRFGLWFAYTQQSQWQVYNGDISRPFRETNYMPELIGSYRPGLSIGGFHWNLIALGYTHQSNGRSEVLSRSWDRLFMEVGAERGNLGLLARAWTRIPEKSSSDDNPRITDYLGHGQLTAYYRLGDHGLSLWARGNPRTGKGAAQFSWVTPPLIGPLRGYVQLFSGYGESLIDYDWHQNTIGLGLTLNDLF